MPVWDEKQIRQLASLLLLLCGISPERLPPPVSREAARKSLQINEQKTLLSIGRVVPRKGMDMVIRALPRIQGKIPDVLYLVAGEGQYRQELEHLARNLKVESRVRFIGRFSDKDLATLCCSADIFVLPNRYVASEGSVEGFGIVFLEAAFYGLPVIAGRSGGAQDAVRDGETVWIVNPESPSEIADAVCHLLENEEQRREMGERGRKNANTVHLWRHVAERLNQAIRNPTG